MNGFQKWRAKSAFGQQVRLNFYEQLEMLIINKTSTPRALDILYDNASGDGKKRTGEAVVLDEIRRAHNNGKSFPESIQGWVPLQEQMLIEAGSIKGHLPQALRNISELSEGASKITGAMFSLLYPIILITFLLAFFTLFNTMVVPMISDILPPDRWKGLARLFHQTSSFIAGAIIPLSIALAGLLVLIPFSMPRWTGRLRRSFDRVPPWSLYRMSTGIGFLLSLSALLRSGVPVPDALRKIRQNASPYLEEKVHDILQQINSGHTNIGIAIERSGHEFPEQGMVRLLKVYADLKGFEDVLDRVSRRWLNNTVKTIQGKSKVIMVLALFAVAITMAWMAFSIFDLQDQIKDAARRM